MRLSKPALVVAEVLLTFPAALFMTSLFVRNLQPLQYEPARTAQRVVDWYAHSGAVGLWVLLITMPSTVLVTGALAVLHRWRTDPELRRSAQIVRSAFHSQFGTAVIAAAALASCGVLAVVALHLLTD